MSKSNGVGRGWVIALSAMLAAAGCGQRGDAGDAPEGESSERAALEARQAEVEADQVVIGAFRVASTRYRFEVQDNGWSRPYLDLVMENGTPLEITAFTVLASLTSPGRKDAWMQQELMVPVAGNVAPGAAFEITLTPSPDSPWALANATPDARMTVEVLTVTAGDGERFLGAGSFRAEDALRLEQLQR
ncbi:hypothetical protein [Arenimonas alkanexedens]